jgi:hypothetical protein
MRLTRLLLAAAFTLAAAQLSFAIQRGSTPVPTGVNPNVPIGPAGTPVRGGGVRPTHETVDSGGDTFVTTRSFAGEVVEVNAEEGYIVVSDPKKGDGKFLIGKKTRLKADKEVTPLADKKQLTLEDFEKGQTVKVTYWPQNHEATEVRVRQPKS